MGDVRFLLKCYDHALTHITCSRCMSFHIVQSGYGDKLWWMTC